MALSPRHMVSPIKRAGASTMNLLSKPFRLHIQTIEHTRSPDPSSKASDITVNMVSISVEPPSQVQRGTVLYPPLVVSCPNGQYAFFQVVLIDSHGRIADQQYIQGTLSMSPQALESSSHGSRGPKDYAVFPDLIIGRSGTFTLHVNAYQMDYQSMPPSMYHASTAATREIRVRSGEVSDGRPSGSEARLLDRLAQAGFTIP
ncbi:hypothetical protein F5B22DRAFT_14043 [Xylaria bambusicola]|uniref:uncharacterized protein n=1 Tax=Xylaria bambusicola TaxID=326684 RepID=UPI002007383D|nr:uncharacterized protein F5B22DRAFT_14043 [Xylaria bambusicola]KAI0527977.1 hypothetical protein F5B22DRAFT_14043 [Xylaria bambusicola]